MAATDERIVRMLMGHTAVAGVGVVLEQIAHARAFSSAPPPHTIIIEQRATTGADHRQDGNGDMGTT